MGDFAKGSVSSDEGSTYGADGNLVNVGQKDGQARMQGQQDREAASAYWQSTLDGCQAISFPTLPPAVQQPVADATTTYECPPLAKSPSNGTISTLVHAAWAIIASNYTNLDDVVFGTTVTGRNALVTGIEAISEPNIAIVPVRVRIQIDDKVSRFLHDLQQQAVQSIPYQQTGLQQIAKVSADAEHACNFQTLLVLRPASDDKRGEETIGEWHSHSELQEFKKFALVVQCVLDTQGVKIKASFDPRVLERWNVDKMLRQFSFVMQQLTGSDEEAKLATIHALTPEDRQQLWEWNQDVPQAIDRCIHDLFTEQARARPNAPAICAWDGEMTYGDLNALSSRLAGHLLDLGVKPEDIVPLCFEKSMWTVVAIFAVLKAGGAFLLLDPSLPRERLRLMCSKVSGSLAVSSQASALAVKDLVSTVVIVDRDSICRTTSHASRTTTVRPRNTAYVIFTSGSTGEPKGCRVEHQAACSSAIHHGHTLGMQANTRTLQFSSYSFAVSLVELLTTFVHGGCICILSEEERRLNLASAISGMRVNWAFFTSTVLDLITPESVASLDVLCVGGDPIRPAQIEQWEARVHLRQVYGSSEAAGAVSSTTLTSTSTNKDVGRAMTGIFWIVNPNDHDRLVPIGAVGEVLIEGPALGRDYIDDADKTAVSFIEAPAWRDSLGQKACYKRLYKTGDLAKYKNDGSIELIGRKDNQVKLRGQRIELGEIEHQVRQAKSGVKEAVVELIRPRDSVVDLLACFIVVDDNPDDKDTKYETKTQQAIQKIQERLDRFLPQYMVPSEFIAIPYLPLTWSRKIDRKKIRQMGMSFSAQQLAELRTKSQGPKRQPTSAMEKTMQQLWAQVLNIDADTIGLDDSFFRLGGDSIAAIKLVAEVRKQDIQLTVASIFQYPKLVDLAVSAYREAPTAAQHIKPFSLLNLDLDTNTAQIQEEVAASCGLDRGLIEDIYPCSPLQEGLMSLTSRRAGDYIMQSILELRNDIDESIFQAAWEQVVMSSAVLRTRIVQHSKLGLLQAVVAEGIQWVEVKSDNLKTYLEKDNSATMQLGDPLARYALVKEREGEKRWFVWTAHHALYDGWSMPLMVDAVSRAYQGATVEKPPEFNAFIQHLGQQNQEAALAYWQATFAGCEAVPFPPLPLSVQQPVANMVLEYQCPPLPKTPSNTITSNTTTSTLIRAAWAIVARNYTNSDDVVFGATVMGRNAPVAGIEAMLGPTIATVPVRVCLQKELTVVALLNKVQQQATEMIPYEQTGLQRIAKMGADAQHACNFQTLLVVQPANSYPKEALGKWHNRLELQEFTTYALMVQCTLAEEGVQITASFDPRAIERWQVEKMMGQFSFVMNQMAEAEVNVGTTIADIQVLTSEDKQQLWGWNAKVPAVVERCVHDLFTEQARARPTAPAICAWDCDTTDGDTTYSEMTYGELDALSSRLADYLADLGVKPEVIVPLCFEKSMWTVVAMLAVLKAGGAFAPLDPEHPASRHEEIIQQTKASIVLASEQHAKLCQSEHRTVVTVSKESVHQLSSEVSKKRGARSTAQPGNSAYVLFTSGSTGTPKGVVIEHQAILTSSLSHGKAFRFTEDTRALQFASYTFDVCITEIWTTLIFGGCTCVPSESDRRNSLPNTISRAKVNLAYVTPTIARLLDYRAVPSLKTLILGGEQMTTKDFVQWNERVHLINAYGPTECSVLCNAYLGFGEFYTGFIGKSIASVSWVVDPDDYHKLAPLGSVGELLVEGPILARGYLNDAEKTAAAFVEDPVWLVDGCRQHPGRRARLYKTGDLVQYDKDGNLVCIGRKDGQVKVRGQRVELGEIEHHVRNCMAEQVAVEVITPGNEKDKAVVAVFVQEEEEVSTKGVSAARVFFPAEVDSYLGERLPSYMVPGVYIAVTRLPTTTSGKIDRRQLRDIGSSFSAQQLAELHTKGPKQQPTTAMEKTMRQLWAQVLNINADIIGLDDSFFHLGGDSITAMKLVAEARKQQDIQLTVAIIFHHPKLINLAVSAYREAPTAAQHIKPFSLLNLDLDTNTAQIQEEVAASCGLDRGLIEDIYPCSPLQEGLMSLTSRRAGDYIMQSVLELRNDTDESIFQAAWEQVVMSSAVLRTRIVQHSKLGLLQAVVAGKVEWKEANGLDEYLKKDKSTSMGLCDPLARYTLVKEREKRWFVWTAHHALYDGWSLPRMVEAVRRAYQGAAVVEKPPEFNAFIKYLSQQNQEAASTYWQATFARCEAVMFPPPLPSTVQQPVADAMLEYQCPPLPKTASNTTTSTLIRAAWAVVTASYTNSDDVVFGATVMGRNAPVAGVEAMLGPTIATVPVRVRLARGSTVSALLKTVQQEATKMIPYEQTGLQRIAKMGADAQHACNFQTLLIVQPANNYLEIDNALGKWYSRSELQDFTTYALMVQCTLAEEGVRITASFDPRAIEQWQVEKMMGQFSFVMNQMAEAEVNVRTTIADIQVLTSEDKQQLWGWNAKVPAVVERCVHDLFTEQARARPNAPAICAWDGEMTYGELDALSSRLASHLVVDLGVKPEDIVPLCFEKSMWTVVAMLAVLKAGGAFTPLDPEHPASRLEEIFRQTKARVVLSSEQHLALCRGDGRAVVTVSAASLNRLTSQSCKAKVASEPRNVAYIMFTSGSTGTPKGVVLEHASVSTSCLTHGKVLGLSPGIRALQFAAYTFDACITEIVTTILLGACICVPSDEDRRNDLSHAISALGVNWAFLVPTVARTINPGAIPSLETLVLGGEQVNSVDWERWYHLKNQMNAYGPTECSVWCTSHSNAEGFTSGMIGKSMASMSWVVFSNDHNRLAPVGSVGELLVEGPILARGYLDDTEKTAVAFICDPAWLLEGCNQCPGRRGRLYKTGDLVRYTRDGNLVYVGRKDGQVKVRGQRVELREIEHHVRNCMAKQVAVEVITPGNEKDKAVVAVFVQEEEEVSTKGVSAARVFFPAEVDSYLGERLPSYMVPGVYIAVTRLPTTASGKTNRRQLREIGASFSAQQLAELRTKSQGPKRQPTTAIEKTLQQMWAQVLNIDLKIIGLDDSFFRLGGDSIAAMKLVGEARRVGMQLTVADVFRSPKLCQFTTVATASAVDSPTTIPRVDHNGPASQSFAQGRLWFLEELYPGLNWYLIPFTVRIQGPLKLEALKSALLAVESRHETLRTTFDTVNGVGVQVVRPFCSNDVNIIEIPAGDEQRLMDALQRDQATPFNLRLEPGWRATIYRVAKDEYVLSIVMHHIISDGWSLGVLMRELTAFYSAATQGQDLVAQVQPLPIQYRDFSVWQREQAQADEHQKQLSYWLAQLHTNRPAELPCDKPRPATLSGQADMRTIEIGGPLYAKLHQFCKSHGVTQFVVLLAAFRATHFRLTGQDDATIGTPNANRDKWEVKDIVGFFVNMQCLRIPVGEETFVGLVDQVYNVVVASHANADVPFENIVSKLKNDRDLSRHPLIQIVFAVHTQQDFGQLKLEGVETEAVAPSATSRFDLEFHFHQQTDSLQGNVLFSTDLYDPQTIDNMLSVFRSVLDICLKEPETVVASLPLLSEAHFCKLDDMGLIQVEETAYPRDSSIVDLFRQQASACPSRLAVQDASAKMTYAQLDEASDALAWWLAKRSLAPDTLIGVLANRSCEAIIAFLGILKANLAYLPFDVKTPAKRIEAILSSLPDHIFLLIGADVPIPDMQLSKVGFAGIRESLIEAMDEFASQQSVTTVKGPSATSLAYVMFTSGSTGQPKGVMVEHRGIVRLVRDNNLVQYLPASPVMAHMSNLAFDASTWEIYASLLHGGTIVCIGTMEVLDPEVVLRIFRQHHVQSAFMTPTLMGNYAKQLPILFADIKMLCVGGEALQQRHIQSIENAFTGKLVNSYGPTENSGWSTLFLVEKKERSLNGVPIGRALSNSGAYVMDSKLNLVPLGIVGELVVTGDGVARGYTDPSRDIDRFVSVTIAGQTVKAYRTGDYVRWRPTDGELEFFGRVDGQVKIRGNRVEVGEIEHVLLSHKSVSEAVVVIQQIEGEEARLAGFVTANEGTTMANAQHDNSGESHHVDAWETKFDSELYLPISDVRPESIGRDFVGWTSMFDGSEIDKGEMNEWLEDTIHTLLDIHRPNDVLEVGSGTGMILFNLGDGLQSYVGLEPSQKAIDFIAETVKSMPVLSGKVQMHKATAADVGRLEKPITASLVILNSVVQYFPSLEYLFKTVQQLLKIGSVRTIFFGDIRSYALHREFLATRSLRIAGDKATKAYIQRMVADMERVERELLVDPGFFTALPEFFPGLVEHVEILPKKMKATNELSCYRYTAVVHVRATNQQTRDIRSVGDSEWIDFVEHQLERQSLLQLLKDLPASSTIAVSNIPYSKTIADRCLIDALDGTEAETFVHQDWLSGVHQRAQRFASLSPTDLVELAREANYQVEISWNRQHSQHGGFDAIFHRYRPQKEDNRIMFRFPTDHADRPLDSLGSKPLQRQFLQKTRQELLEIAEGQLPAYMVPQTITVLDAMPMNQNGKVDRKALAGRIEAQKSHREPAQQPTSVAEKTMQRLWAQVLNIDANTIGLDDSFFRLGGDSIAAMKLVAEARKQDIQLTVASIFQYPNLIDLVVSAQGEAPTAAQHIEPFSLLNLDLDADTVQIQEEVAAICGLDGNLIEDTYPCSPLQVGLMSLTSKRAGDYVMQSVLELGDNTDKDAFQAAWEQVVRSSAVLRTRIVQHSTLGLLQAVVVEGIQWVEVESDNLKTYLAKDKSATMQLGDPLARYALVKEREGEGEKRWFVWTVHHALYDGWSLPRILDAVRKTYQGAAVEKPPGFNAFIQHLGQQNQETVTRYWQAVFANCEATPFPPLPSTVQQPVADSILEYQCPPLPKTTSNTTTSTLIRAAWAIVARNYSNSDDIIFGATVTGRNAPVAGIEAMLGPTIATVPVRVRLQKEKELTVLALLNTVQQQATEMIPYEQTGLQRIAKMGADAQHACNFQTLLVVQPANSLEMEEALGKWHNRSELQDFTTYALMVQCTPAEEGVRITASFDPRAIEQWQVEKMMGQFSFVINQMAEADVGTTIANIQVLTSKDKQQLWGWNAKVPAVVERCVHDLFTEQARARPNAPAICAWDGEMTYGELDALSSRLASHLVVDLGVKPEDIVPLCFEKSMWTVVAMLAVLKAGGAFTPLDPEHPASRLEEIFRQTRASVVLASERHAKLCQSNHRTIVTVSEASVHQLVSKVTRSIAQPGNSAYVLFTSGSTGTPKGVVIEHQAISTSILSHGKELGFTQDTRALQFASYTFDACIAEIWTTLIHGGCTCVPSESDRRDSLSKAISRMGTTWAFLTPTVARLLDRNTVASLSTLVMGGEIVRSTDWDIWDGYVRRLIHVYGPTECCVFSTVYPNVNALRSAVIGKAIASVSWVVDNDDHNKLAPVGSVGELLVEGPILARGYLDDAKTAAAFIYDPAWLLEGCEQFPGRRGRLYKTGDLVRYDADGNLMYVGRKDGQVKVRGQRVELGEIEHHVRDCMANQVVVEVITPGNEKDKAVVAVFVQQEGGSAARIFFPTEVDSYLGERLPSYMVPGVYIAVTRLPTTTSGKTDRRQLREMGASFSAQQLAELRTKSQGPKRQPTTVTEKTMQRLWAQVLDIDLEIIGLDDSFFRLGGDSIAAMKLVAEARKQDIQLTVAAVFRTSILHDLALLPRHSPTPAFQPPANFSLLSPSVHQAVISSGTQCRPFVAMDRVEDILPVSFVQKHYLDHGKRNSQAAFNYTYIDLNPSLDVERLENSCRSLTQHFAILRTHFAYCKDHLLQLVLRDFDAPFSRFEVNGSMDEESNAVVLRDICQSSPLGVPTSFMFIRNDSKAARLLIRLSHAQYDGLCIPVILNALASLFHNKSLSPAPDFSTYLAYSRQRAPMSACYWRDLLKGSRLTLITPKLSPTACVDSPRNIKLERSIPMPQLPGEITIASLVSSAWALVLSHVSGEEDVVYGQLVAGRNSDIPGITEIVGPCINMIPVRADVSAARTAADLVRSIQEQYVSVGESDSMGFNDIVGQCTDWPAGTTCDSFVQHQNIDEHPEIYIAGGISKVQWFDNPFAVAPQLSIFSQAQAGSLDVTINSNTHILTAECAEKLLDLLCETTSKLCADLPRTLELCKSSLLSFV